MNERGMTIVYTSELAFLKYVFIYSFYVLLLPYEIHHIAFIHTSIFRLTYSPTIKNQSVQ